ncbi:MAG: hypothetical protein H6835_16650 [Planctomycetes bacterium]|nr:hypothetical protein [Planctomycetota bacterium]
MSRSRPLSLSLLSTTLAALLATAAHAQCDLDWQPGSGVPGPFGTVYASARLPGGDLIVGGNFGLAGDVRANSIARYDGTRWSAIGSGIDGIVRCMTTLPNGDVVIGGSFQHADGVPAAGVVRFDGTSFHAYGAGLDTGGVYSLLALPNGDLLAGGNNLFSAGQHIPGVGRWDGTAWSPFITSPLSGGATSMARLSNGDLLFAPILVQVGSGFAGPLVRYDGTTFTDVPGLSGDSDVMDVLPLDLGRFAICGQLVVNGAATGVALFDGTTTISLGAPTAEYRSLAATGNGDLLAGGYTSNGLLGHLARFDGQSWSVAPSGCPRGVSAIVEEPNGAVLVCGLGSAGHPMVEGSVRRLVGTSWIDLGTSAPIVNVVAALPNGDFVVAGQFSSIGGIAANNVARWDGTNWHAMGSGVNGTVTCIAVNDQGMVAVGGPFQLPGTLTNGRVAIWNGVSWTSPGNGTDIVPTQIAINQPGQVLVTSGPAARRFDGAAWSTLPPLNGVCYGIAVDGNGEFVLAGVFVQIPGSTVNGVVRLTGGAFVPEPTGMTIARAILRLRDGSIAAAGNGVGTQLLRLQGGVWTPLPSPPPFVTALDELPNGDLLAIATPTSGPTTLHQLHGATTTTLAEVGTYANGAVVTIATADHGEVLLAAAGGLLLIDGAVSAGVARALPTCPAAATATGSGCYGAAGPVTLGATDLPWLGATFHARVAGMAVPTIGLHVAGVAPTLLPLPLGAPGCTLQVDPALIGAFVPSAVQSDVAFAVPTDAALIGQQLLTQVVALELDATGAITRTTSSNALQLTVGAF